MLDRLIGLETEYAIYVDRQLASSNSPEVRVESTEIFQGLCEQLQQVLPLVPGEHSDRRFLANGASVSFEASVGIDGEIQGLIEGATPECRSPSSLVAHQLAQDELFESCLNQLPPEGSIRLIKNSADPQGALYGVQENYEVEIAKGWRLWSLRLSLILLLPVVVMYWILATGWLSTMQLIAWGFMWFKPSVEASVAQTDATTPQSVAAMSSLGGRTLRMAIIGLRVLHAPLAFFLTIIVRLFVLNSQLDRLAPFFATRIILDGAGHLDASGRFWLGAKASACDRWIGLGGYWGGRPIFVFGHWLKTLCAPGLRPWQSLAKLFRARQRVQVALGDSCMSPVSQYLRSGITCLLLDWVEQAPADPLTPRLRSPLEALKSVARDDLLIAKFQDTQGKNWNALEVQFYYLQQVKDFLQQSWQVPSEAWRIVRLWQETLESLQASKHDAKARQSLLGKVDWLSKWWMLKQVADEASWGVRKKVDIRFHELSEDGYYRKLIAVVGSSPLIPHEKIAQAKRVPPADTIASKRGYLIREFSAGDAVVTAGWDFVKIVDNDGVAFYDLANDFWNSSNR